VKRIASFVAAAVTGLCATSAAQAHVSIGFSIGIPFAPAYPVYAPPPVYYAPPPPAVYYPSPPVPVIVHAPPPAVVVGGGYGYYGYHPYYSHGYRGRGYRRGYRR
jgi:hypothetical protein